MDQRCDLAIVGGGIVGLAAALHATAEPAPRDVVVLEKEDELARHQTGHNSGVIHSGVYYKPGSLKARNCVAGAAAMVDFCRTHDLPHEICGKVIVATTEKERQGLAELLRRGTANGVPGLSRIGPERLKELEPHAAGLEALHVPGAGITDYRAVALKYADLVRARGGRVLTGCEVRGVARRDGGVVLDTTRGAIAAARVINCAGLHSDRVMRLAGDSTSLRIIPFRGEYYTIATTRRYLVKNLIYPVPDPAFPFLGVHFTRGVHGGIEAGPNAVLALSREGYRHADVSARDILDTVAFPGFWRMSATHWRSGLAEYRRSLSARAFADSLRTLVPEFQDADLEPGGAGVRAQAVHRSGRLLDDFEIVQSPRITHVCNVPSPAATASLLIGRQIVELSNGSGQAAGA